MQQHPALEHRLHLCGDNGIPFVLMLRGDGNGIVEVRFDNDTGAALDTSFMIAALC